MSDSDERSKIEEETLEAVRQLTPEVARLLEGQTLLEGPASVQLMFRVEDAATPQEAVEMTIRRIAHVGLDSFTFVVTDSATGDDYFVRAGQLIELSTLEEG